MNADKMREVLGSHPGFKNEKSSTERFLEEERGHIVYMLPKFHCELNLIERVWAQSKLYTKAYCKYSIVSLRKSFFFHAEVTLMLCQRFFFFFGYTKGMML